MSSRRMARSPLGSSGIQIRFETDLIIEGVRPGRVVRVRPRVGLRSPYLVRNTLTMDPPALKTASRPRPSSRNTDPCRSSIMIPRFLWRLLAFCPRFCWLLLVQQTPHARRTQRNRTNPSAPKREVSPWKKRSPTAANWSSWIMPTVAAASVSKGEGIFRNAPHPSPCSLRHRPLSRARRISGISPRHSAARPGFLPPDPQPPPCRSCRSTTEEKTANAQRRGISRREPRPASRRRAQLLFATARSGS